VEKYNYDSGKAWKTWGIFFSYFVATLIYGKTKLLRCGNFYGSVISSSILCVFCTFTASVSSPWERGITTNHVPYYIK